jgi:hypothetical protein
MTRKDYELIASVLANFVGDAGDVIDRDKLALALASALAQDNPRFNRERFLVASGYLAKCDREGCNEYGAIVTSRARFCSYPHGPEWVTKVRIESARA